MINAEFRRNTTRIRRWSICGWFSRRAPAWGWKFFTSGLPVSPSSKLGHSRTKAVK